MDEVTNIEDWVVQQFRYDRRRVAVLLGASDAAAPWLAKLRRLLPELEGRAPAELLEEVRRSGRIELGIVEGRVAHAIREKLRGHGYEVTVEDASTVGHLAGRWVAGEFWALMDDDDEGAEAFCLDLIARGARVEDVVEE